MAFPHIADIKYASRDVCGTNTFFVRESVFIPVSSRL